MQETINYVVTLTRADGHVFNNGFATIAQVRDFLTNAAIVLMPGDTLVWRVA